MGFGKIHPTQNNLIKYTCNFMGKLLILSGGMSSRMKKQLEAAGQMDPRLIEQANSYPKAMIGVGKDGRPFLDYLLYHAHLSGYEEVVILKNPKDEVTVPHYEQLVAQQKNWGLKIGFATQHIPSDRTKPLGTADAVEQALEQTPHWKGQHFTVCNADNLYSVEVLQKLRTHEKSNVLPAYDREKLEMPWEQIRTFALLKTNAAGFLEAIVEKPSDAEVEEILTYSGRLGVSMNIFRFAYDDIFHFVKNQPLHPVRNEKELPSAVGTMASQISQSVWTFPWAEKVPDMTSKADISVVQQFLADTYGDF
jgi:glucose-1-phosphate adenylyltransferase